MKVLIVSAWRDRYVGDARARTFPSLSAIHLAALVPPPHEVAVAHEHIAPVDPDAVDADLVAITATTGSAVRMYELADRLRARGITVAIGGPHASLVPGEAARHADAVAIGEADRTFGTMVEDFARGRLASVYRQPEALPLDGLPVPRYDLLEDGFRFRGFVQATRGCPYRCTFCTLKALDRRFRVRPVREVIRDIQAADARTWLQRKFVWFWDDNLTGDRRYAAELFRQLVPLRKWWWTQCSIDVAREPDLLRLAADSGCLAVFVGLETFSAENLLAVGKSTNRVAEYRDAVRAFHDVGIAVHAGIIVGMEHDSESTIRLIPELVDDLGIDLPFLNVLTPFPGTPLRDQLEREGRVLSAAWERHNASAIVFKPKLMGAGELETAYWDTHHALHCVRRTARRIARTIGRVRAPAVAINGYVNSLLAVQNLLYPDGPWPEDRVA